MVGAPLQWPAGIVTIPLTWLLARRLFGSVWWATLAAFLVATDGMLIAQSRTAILDSLLPPLVVGAALALTIHLDTGPPGRLSRWTVTAGSLLGLAVAVKWQAGSALVGVLAAFVIVGRHDRRAVARAIPPSARPRRDLRRQLRRPLRPRTGPG